MCIDDKRRRVYCVIQLTGPIENGVDLTIQDTRGLIGLELTGYQFDGVPVVAGIPYSMAFFIGLKDCPLSSEMLVTNNGTPMAGVCGIPCQLATSYTTQQYDTPRLMGTRSNLQPGLPANTTINIDIRDDSGQSAQFTKGRIYCNLVYDQGNALDMSAAVTRSREYWGYSAMSHK